MIFPSIKLSAICIILLCSGVAVAQDRELVAKNYRQADTNNDGNLALSEFTTFIDLNAADGLGNAVTISSRKLHARAFRRIDANRDGMVTQKELQDIR